MRPPADNDTACDCPLADAGVALCDAPAGCRARLALAAGGGCEALAAMGMTADEVVLVHKRGEPTIVSLGTWNGRRIGLTRRAAREIRVLIDG